MAMSPSSLLAKLEELKKWQQDQQERLLKNHYKRLESVNTDHTGLSDDETIKGLSAFDSFHSEPNESPIPKPEPAEPEIIIHDNGNNKPKKPFLKRGTGLQKFGMQAGDQKRPFNKMKPQKTAVHKRLAELRKVEKFEQNKLSELAEKSRPHHENTNEQINLITAPHSSQNVQENNIIKKAPINLQENAITKKAPINVQENIVIKKAPEVHNLNHSKEIEITPLKMPEVSVVQPKAKWSRADEQNDDTPIVSNYKTPGNVISSDFLLTLRQLAVQKFGPCDSPKVLDSKTPNREIIEYLQQLVEKYGEDGLHFLDSIDSKCADFTAQEQALERELKNFEKLEQKVEQSDFCSTNTSVVELLSSSTPQQMSVGETDRRRSSNFGAKKSLQFHESTVEEVSDHSSVTSADFDCQTTQQEWTQFDQSSETASESSVHSMHGRVIVKQNACVMTDDLPVAPVKEPESSEDVLKKKLRELDAEILNFRKENAKLQQLKAEMETERREFQKEKKKAQKELQDEKIRLEFEADEEKKKFAKEKMVFERYVKDLQNKPSRKEREEISMLKADLVSVRETLKLKDTRNGTTQARLRNQIKALEKENANLKEELEKLQKQNGKLVASQKIARKPSETKMLHEINKNLTKLTQDAKIVKNVSKAEKSIAKLDDSLIMLEENSRRKQTRNNNYETEYRRSFNKHSDSEESVSDFRRSDEFKERKTFNSQDKTGSKDITCEPKRHSSEFNCEITPRLSNERIENDSREDSGKSSEFSRQGSELSWQEVGKNRNDGSQTHLRKQTDQKENDKNTVNFDFSSFRNLSDLSVLNNYERVFGKENGRNSSLNDTQGSASGKIETILENGSKETKYANGNIKTTSQDGNFITMKYFNGDIKETRLLDGTINYYFAETKMWQKTFPDGNEILTFSDGQIEKHFTDGSAEIIFTNGVIKHTDQDGNDKISYPDGSVVTINNCGEKVLLLPNGQKEIHTKDHKRREYPDGTVKILYPDGLQETRYSNGRIRLKDNDGNLLMDSHADQ